MIRANRFHFEMDRTAYIAGRGILRYLLAGYLNSSPAEIRFQYSDYHKPYLDNEIHPERLYFNVSHSTDLAIYGFTYVHELGVDVEKMRPRMADKAVARRFFSASEQQKLFSLPEGDAFVRGFFNCWTRKEAILKATGEGLSRPLDQFDV